MQPEIAKANGDVLWNEPNAILTCDDKFRLSTISSWNLIGRLINWFKDRNGLMTRKIELAVQSTLETVHAENRQKRCVYFRDRDNGIFHDATRAKSPHYPAYYLAERIKADPKFNSSLIVRRAAEEVIGDKERYPFPKPTKSVIHVPEALSSTREMMKKDPRILDWNDERYV